MPESKSIGTKFYNQFNNGENLDQNLTDYTPNLVGNVGDRIKVVQQLAIWWTSVSDSLNTFDIVLSGNTLIRNAGSFVIDGFIVGDLIELRDIGGASDIFVDRNIVSMTATEITFDGAVVSLGSFGDAKLYGKTPLTSCRFKYGLIENNEPTNFVSKIDGTAENGYTNDAITNVAEPMPSLTGVNSWKEVNDSVTIQEIGTFPQIQNYAQSFEIIHVFTILPYFQDGELVNLQTLIKPLLFTTTNTLKYVFECQFNISLSNPNGTKAITIDNVLGSVGWYQESLNGNRSFYKFDSLQYINQDTAQVVSEINSQQETNVKFNLTSDQLTFTALTNVIVSISLLPDLTDYQQNSNTIDENFLLDDAYTTVDTAFVDSSIITNFTATKISNELIEVEFDVDYLSADESRLENKNYLISVATCDQTRTGANTDRTTLLVDARDYQFNPDVEDLIFIDRAYHFPHDVDDTILANGFDNNVGWIEDGFTIKVPIQLNNDLTSILETLKVHFSAYNPSTDNKFHLQSYNFNLSGGTLITSGPLNPYMAFNIINDRNFNLVSGSQFNKANLTSGGFSVRGLINVINYEMIIGIKANFEEWIAQLDADTVFYDILEPNDGLNKKSSRYSLTNGYELIVVVEADVRQSKNSFNTNYQFLSQPHAYYDYDLDNNVTPAWAVEIVTLDDTGINTSGILKTGQNTTVKATFTPDSGSTDLIDPYAIIRLVPVGGNINSILELSSIRESIVGNILIPLDGETYTKITDDGLTVLVECLIDGSILDDSIDYLLTAELRDSSLLVGIETELGVLIETETGDILLIE